MRETPINIEQPHGALITQPNRRITPRAAPIAPALILPQRALRARTTTKRNARGCASLRSEDNMIARRSFITGLAALITAPAIVRVASLMPVKQMIEPELYGAGPMMHALRDMQLHNAYIVVHPRMWADLKRYEPGDIVSKTIERWRCLA